MKTLITPLRCLAAGIYGTVLFFVSTGTDRLANVLFGLLLSLPWFIYYYNDNNKIGWGEAVLLLLGGSLGSFVCTLPVITLLRFLF